MKIILFFLYFVISITLIEELLTKKKKNSINASKNSALSALVDTSDFCGAGAANNSNNGEVCDVPTGENASPGSQTSSFVQVHFHSLCFVILKRKPSSELPWQNSICWK